MASGGPAATRDGARPKALDERADATAASHPGKLGATAVSMVASQLVLGAAGLAALPLLTRQLGPEAYGEFSLFVMLLGAVTYQDVARQLLIREEATQGASQIELDGMARASTGLVAALALALGLALLPLAWTAALVGASVLHGCASRDFATLSASGRVALANGARNLAWAGAFVACAALALTSSAASTLALPFVAANGAVACVYRAAAPRREREPGTPSPLQALRRSEHRPRLRRAALDLLGFTLAASAIAALDRVMLERLVGGEAFGVYCGAADVALRLHIVSSALAAALFPMLAREFHRNGYVAAARRFVAIATRAAPLYFAVLALGVAFADPLLPWLLGPDFAPSTGVFIALLVALFVHSFGFLATPWQRAQGDFRSQRRAYALAACAMVAVGSFAIPRWGAWGAVAAFCAARLAEVQLVGIEIARLPRTLLPRWKLAAAAAMFCALAALGAWRIARG